MTKCVKRNNTLAVQSKSQQDTVPDIAKNAKSAKTNPTVELSNLIIATLEDSKAEDIVRLQLDGKTAIADEMIVASGRSNIHVSSIADKLSNTLKENNYRDIRIEGHHHCDWVLIDAGDIIIHIFRPEVRTFYNLEKLWSPDAPDDSNIEPAK